MLRQDRSGLRTDGAKLRSCRRAPPRVTARRSRPAQRTGPNSAWRDDQWIHGDVERARVLTPQHASPAQGPSRQVQVHRGQGGEPLRRRCLRVRACQAGQDGRGGACGSFWPDPPLRTSEASKEQITPVEGLSALSLDALTSVAYGPEAIIVVVALAGSAALHPCCRSRLSSWCGHLGVLLPAGDRRLSRRRGRLRGFSRQLVQPAWSPRRVDRRLRLTVAVDAAGVGALTSAVPGYRREPSRSLGMLAVITLLNRGLARRRGHLLPTMIFIVGCRHHPIGLIHPLALHDRQPGRSLLTSHGLQTVSRHLARAQGLLGRVQRPHRRRGDRQRGAAV